MNPRLHARLLHLCDLAKTTAPERDVGPALDALGVLLWVAAVGERDTLDAALSKRLKQLAGRTLLALRATSTNDDADQDDTALINSVLIDIARAATLVLERKPLQHAKPALATSKQHPPTRTFATMLEGTADGLTTGRYALHILDCRSCQHTLTTLQTHERPSSVAAKQQVRSMLREPSGLREPSMKMAAADITNVRAPNEGRVVGRKAKPPLEAVLFDDNDSRRLAIYSTDNIAIRMVADGITPEATLTGYWLGRVDNDVREIAATLHCGKQSVKWKVRLDARTKIRTKASKRKGS